MVWVGVSMSEYRSSGRVSVQQQKYTFPSKAHERVGVREWVRLIDWLTDYVRSMILMKTVW